MDSKNKLTKRLAVSKKVWNKLKIYKAQKGFKTYDEMLNKVIR